MLHTNIYSWEIANIKALETFTMQLIIHVYKHPACSGLTHSLTHFQGYCQATYII